ncbi:MAG TPA: UDP-N-acetylmuramoyl-L-alanine--D-glutamate ligase [Candidatus Dormibacteraeota bacterium]|nr:UDP-N-acetylmuramoyl-L-alanine--D-glutamate ligase [Candidatus Dormibacteraeota bacterium]
MTGVRRPEAWRPEAPAGGMADVPRAGERALVVGLGRSGVALSRFLAGRGVLVRACDVRPAGRLGGAPSRLPAGSEVVVGGYDEHVLDGCAAVYASPGVPWDADLLQAARAAGKPVSSEMDLFFRLCPAPIVGVTGTNGKTTTTALIGSVLGQGRRPVLVGGNIGDTVLDRLEEVTPEHWVVLELSSFQLESCAAPRARVAVVLNLTPDHLDRHGTMAAYTAAKARLLRWQRLSDDAVLNGLDPACRELAALTPARVIWFDEHRPVPPVPLPGRHNELNALAAAAVGRAAGLPDDAIEAGVSSFPGVEHRLELVGEWGGVRWYNDSKATNPDAGLVGLRAFAGRPVVLIAGGYGSGFELDAWLAAVRDGTEAVVLMGASADELAERLAGHTVQRAAGLEEAVDLARGLARPGWTVLLSPAYKSFDMFASYEDRGRRFKAAVGAAHRSP